MRQFLLWGARTTFIVCISTFAWAFGPGEYYVTGYLTHNGAAVNGDVAYKGAVWTEQGFGSGSLVGDEIMGIVTVVEGEFVLYLPSGDRFQYQDNLYLELWMDAAGDGLTEWDRFKERFRICEAPYASNAAYFQGRGPELFVQDITGGTGVKVTFPGGNHTSPNISLEPGAGLTLDALGLALAPDGVKSSHIENGTIEGKDIKAGTLTGTHFSTSADLTVDYLFAYSVSANRADIDEIEADTSVTTDFLSAGALHTGNVQSGMSGALVIETSSDMGLYSYTASHNQPAGWFMGVSESSIVPSVMIWHNSGNSPGLQVRQNAINYAPVAKFLKSSDTVLTIDNVGDLIYATPRTRYLVVKGHEFRPRLVNSTVDVRYDYLDGSVNFSNVRLMAPVHIPERARVIGLRMWCMDKEISNNIKVQLREGDVDGNALTLASVESQGSSTSMQSPVVTLATPYTMQHSARGIGLYLYTNSLMLSETIGNMEIHSVLVQYEVDTPLP